MWLEMARKRNIPFLCMALARSNILLGGCVVTHEGAVRNETIKNVMG